MNISKILIFCMLLALTLTSCSGGTKIEKDLGILVTDEVLSSIVKDMQDKGDSSLADDGDVFWTPSGKIWHKSSECSYLSSSKEIYHGSIEEAMLEGKERQCTKCFADETDKLYAELVGNPISANDVFFTRDGECWHTDINCSVISGALEVYNASVARAKELGKTVACEECSR